MLEPMVDVHWPEPEQKEVSKKIRYAIALPDLDRMELGLRGNLPIELIESRHILKKPQNPSRGYGTKVRETRLQLGYYALSEKPLSFMDEGYDIIMSAVNTAFEEQEHASVDSLGADRYAKLAPYFKQAVRAGIDRYHGKYRLRLDDGITKVQDDEVMEMLPDLIVRMRDGVDVLNKQIPLLQRSIVMFWMARYKADAECYRIAANTRTFTPREARKLMKHTADLIRKECSRWGSLYLPVVEMPTVEYEFRPMRVAAVCPRGQVGAEVKSADYNHATQETKPTRLQYGRKVWSKNWGQGGGFREIHERRDEVVSYLVNNCDYNASMEVLANVQKVEHRYVP